MHRFVFALVIALAVAGASGHGTASPAELACGYPLSACWRVSGRLVGQWSDGSGPYDGGPFQADVRIAARWSNQCGGGPCSWNPTPWGGSQGVSSNSNGEFTIISPAFGMPSFSHDRDLQPAYWCSWCGVSPSWTAARDCERTFSGPEGLGQASADGYFDVDVGICRITQPPPEEADGGGEESKGGDDDERKPVIGERDPCAPPGTDRVDLRFETVSASSGYSALSHDRWLKAQVRSMRGRPHRMFVTFTYSVGNGGNADYPATSPCVGVARLEANEGPGQHSPDWQPFDENLGAVRARSKRQVQVDVDLRGTTGVSPPGAPWPSDVAWQSGLVFVRVALDVDGSIPESDENNNRSAEYCYDAANVQFVPSRMCEAARLP